MKRRIDIFPGGLYNCLGVYNSETEATQKQKTVFDWCSSIMASFVVIFVIFCFLFRIVQVSGSSMLQTLKNGDWLIVSSVGDDIRFGDIVVATSFGTFKKVLLGTLGKLPRARKGVKIADLGREGKEKVLLAEAVAEDGEISLAIEDEEGNMYHTVSGEISLESRMGKGKMIPSVGIIKSKGVYSFRVKGQK